MKSDVSHLSAKLAELVKSAPERFVYAVFSAPIAPTAEYKRIKCRPVLVKDRLQIQVASFTKTQCFSVNILLEAFRDELTKGLELFSQLVVRFVTEEWHVHVEGIQAQVKIRECKRVTLPELSHNRPKKHLLQEHEPSELLVALGLQTKQGKIVREKYDKFKQINRFLEIVQDLSLPENAQILDFGCGKAYLTFALYNVLKTAKIIGIDAREDVIQKCVSLKEALGLEGIDFHKRRINEYIQDPGVDLVMALHACDTATDEALAKAIQLQAEAILVAPCCQHEADNQLKKEAWPLLLKHNLLKTRFSALLTDALRAEILEQLGYSVDLVEFIDPEHTPKNLLIRARRRKLPNAPDWSLYRDTCRQFGVHIALERLLQIK